VHVRRTPLTEMTEADARAWHRLADRAVEPNMFLDPRFLVPARDHPEEAGDLQIIAVEEDGEWLAALAVTTRHMVHGLPLLVVTTGGAFMTRNADRHHPLVREGRVAEALEALLRGMTTAGLPGLLQAPALPARRPPCRGTRAGRGAHSGDGARAEPRGQRVRVPEQHDGGSGCAECRRGRRRRSASSGRARPQHGPHAHRRARGYAPALARTGAGHGWAVGAARPEFGPRGRRPVPRPAVGWLEGRP